jgi:hypothetical protein
VFDDVNVLPSAIVTVEPVAGAVSVTLLIVVADATPSVGVVKVGEVAKTKAPLPVSSVTADARLALEGVARNVATPEPRPETPVDIGRPVQLLRVPELGVPKAGVTSVGDVAKTSDPVPVSSEITPRSCDDVVDANCASVPLVKASPVPLAVPHSSAVAPALTLRT